MRNDEPISISLSDIEATLINEAALQDKPGFDYTLIGSFALGLVVLGGLIWAVSRYLDRRRKLMLTNDPSNLFRELCVANALTWSERRTLLKLAQLRKISNPCLVILDVGLWPEEDDPMIGRSFSNRLTEIRRSLFEPMKLPSQVADS
jgi:hypothetical protein